MRHPLVMITATFVVWTAAFLVLYAAQATGCRLELQQAASSGPGLGTVSILRLALIGLAIISLASVSVTILMLRRARLTHLAPETETFIRAVCSHVCLASLCATVFCFAGVVWLTPC
jgi:hypothetical protein